MTFSSLQVSIVTYRPNEDNLVRCLYALSEAIDFARAEGVIYSVNVALIDNSQNRNRVRRLIELGELFFREPTEVSYLHGHANIGYGAAHNLTLHGSGADYHLVLDVNTELAKEALAEGVSWMQANDDTGLISGALYDGKGELLYPCLQYPSVLDLFLTNFSPRFLCRFFTKRLTRYQMRQQVQAQHTFFDIPCFSARCLLVRRTTADQSSGFDPSFFLYFGDYDLTLQLSLIARTAYLPTMQARLHHVPDLPRQSIGYTWWFVKDALTFFRKNGWKWW